MLRPPAFKCDLKTSGLDFNRALPKVLDRFGPILCKPNFVNGPQNRDGEAATRARAWIFKEPWSVNGKADFFGI